jgi:translocation protein SEC63
MSFTDHVFLFFQRYIRSIEEFVKMREEDRRNMLRNMSDDDYRDVMNVCASMPYIQMNVTSGGESISM